MADTDEIDENARRRYLFSFIKVLHIRTLRTSCLDDNFASYNRIIKNKMISITNTHHLLIVFITFGAFFFVFSFTQRIESPCKSFDNHEVWRSCCFRRVFSWSSQSCSFRWNHKEGKKSPSVLVGEKTRKSKLTEI